MLDIRGWGILSKVVLEGIKFGYFRMVVLCVVILRTVMGCIMMESC